GKLQIDLKPRKSVTITAVAALDTIEATVDAALSYHGGKWELDKVTADSNNVSMGTANKVLNIPYAISGGRGTGAYLRWEKLARSPEQIDLVIGGAVDEVNLVPAGTRNP